MNLIELGPVGLLLAAIGATAWTAAVTILVLGLALVHSLTIGRLADR